MIKTTLFTGRFACAATLIATCFMFGSGYASAAPHALVRGLVSRDAQPPTHAFCRAEEFFTRRA